MRRSLVALVPVGVSLFLAACEADHSTTSPNAIAPRQSVSADLTLACSFNTMSQDAKKYFMSTDPVFTMISDMKTLFRTSRAAATPKGFDILTRVAAVRLTSTQLARSTADNGGAFVNDVLGCMDVGPIPDTFNATASLASGVFEVRGDVAGAGPALAFDGTAGGQRVASLPEWGVEASAAWPTSTGAGQPRYLVYGYPLSSANFDGETPTAGFNAFEVGTLRADVPKDGLVVGVCTRATVIAANRLLHDNAIVPNESPTFCGPVASLSTKSWFAMIVDRAGSFFSPRQLFAQGIGDFDQSFIGGGPSGWSPMVFAQLTGTSIALTFATEPKNTSIAPNTLPTFVVHASTAAGHAVPGINVTISIAGNNGVPANAVLTPLNPTAVTDVNGDATFMGVLVNKAGGYTLTATGSLGGVATLSSISTLFNVKNK
jgi:hypothetical protein